MILIKRVNIDITMSKGIVWIRGKADNGIFKLLFEKAQATIFFLPERKNIIFKKKAQPQYPTGIYKTIFDDVQSSFIHIIHYICRGGASYYPHRYPQFHTLSVSPADSKQHSPLSTVKVGAILACPVA